MNLMKSLKSLMSTVSAEKLSGPHRTFPAFSLPMGEKVAKARAFCENTDGGLGGLLYQICTVLYINFSS
jgi:hypothetical protein